MLEVTALGAVCESEDLAAPRHVHSDDADQPARFGFVGIVGPAELLEQERRAMLEAGILAISAVEFADLSDGTRVGARFRSRSDIGPRRPIQDRVRSQAATRANSLSTGQMSTAIVPEVLRPYLGRDVL